MPRAWLDCGVGSCMYLDRDTCRVSNCSGKQWGERRREGAEEAEERGERRGGESLRFRNSSHVYASVCVMCDSLSLPEHTTLSPEHNNDYFPGTPRPHTLPPIQPARLRLRPLPPCTPLPSSPPRPANHAAAAEPSRAPSRFYSRFSEPDPALRAACRVDPAEGALGGLEVADVLLAHRPVQHCARRDGRCVGSTFRPKPGRLECLRKTQDNIMLNNTLSQLSRG